MVDVVSYKMFAMVVACSVEQRDINNGRATGAVAQNEYVCEELSTTKIRSVSSLKFKESAVFSKCETSEGLCRKVRDFKSMSSIDYNTYQEGTRCFANKLKGVRSRYCISVCSG